MGIKDKIINIIAWLIIGVFIITFIVAIWDNIGRPVGPSDWIYWP